MKHKLLVSIALMGILSSCAKDSPRKPDDEARPVTHQSTQCYAYAAGKDTVKMKLIISDGIATGDLSYTFFEKDKSTGTFQGTMNGDTLFAIYTFLSEGTSSVREVAFLRMGNDLVEGYGDVEEKAGMMKWKDRNTITFTSNMILQRVDCVDLH